MAVRSRRRRRWPRTVVLGALGALALFVSAGQETGNRRRPIPIEVIAIPEMPEGLTFPPTVACFKAFQEALEALNTRINTCNQEPGRCHETETAKLRTSRMSASSLMGGQLKINQQGPNRGLPVTHSPSDNVASVCHRNPQEIARFERLSLLKFEPLR